MQKFETMKGNKMNTRVKNVSELERGDLILIDGDLHWIKGVNNFPDSDRSRIVAETIEEYDEGSGDDDSGLLVTVWDSNAEIDVIGTYDEDNLVINYFPDVS